MRARGSFFSVLIPFPLSHTVGEGLEVGANTPSQYYLLSKTGILISYRRLVGYTFAN